MKKQNAKKWIAISLVVCLLVGSLAMAMVGCARSNKENVKIMLSVDGIANVNDLAFTSPEGVGDGNGDFSTISRTCTLTATVTPANAGNQLVNWSVAFVDPTETWAVGKSAGSYVTVTPTSEGALTATVRATAAFGADIKVTCTSRTNPEATAYCVFKYAARTSGYGYLTFSYDSQSYGNTGSIGLISFDQNRSWYCYNSTLTNVPSYKAHTVNAINVATTSMAVKVSSAFYTQLSSQGIARAQNDWVTFTKEHSMWNAMTSSNIACAADIDAMSDGQRANATRNIADAYSKFCNAALDLGDNVAFQIKVCGTTDFETFEYTFDFKIDRTNMTRMTTSLSLSSNAFVL